MGRVAAPQPHRSPFLSPSYLIVLLALLPALVMIWGPGYPGGADTWGHLFKAEYLAARMQAEGPTALFHSAWMPAWYMGDPYRTYYPPLTVLTLAPLIYLLQDSFLAYRVFISLFLLLFAHLTYAALAGHWERERWPAAFTTALILWAPYTLRTLFFEGNLPRSLAVLALPLLAYLTELALARPGREWLRTLGLSLVWSWAILAHVQQAYMFAIGFGLYAVLRVILDPEVPLVRLAWAIIPIALGAAVAAPWLLPAYSHGELPDVPYLPPVKVDLFSAPLQAIIPAVGNSPGTIAFGTGVLLLALLSAIARPNPRRTAWLLSGLLCLWFAFGPPGVAFSLLPGHDQLLPERFANFSAFALPIAAGGIMPLGIQWRRVRALIVAGLIFIDIFPSIPLLRGHAYPADRAAIGQLLAQQPPGGRVALMVYPEPTALDVYFASAVGQHDQTNGWALENTPQHIALRRMLSAPDWGPGYLARLFGLWDVRYAIVFGSDIQAQEARNALTAAGFALKGTAGEFELWSLAQRPSPLQRLPAQQMLVVGKQTEPFLAAYPFAADGSETDLADYSSTDLENYPALGLMRFNSDPADLPEAEAKLKAWASTGRTAIVDLSGMEEPFSQGLDFLGVGVLRLSFRDAFQIDWHPPLQDLPPWLPLQGLAEPPIWNGAVYHNLDGVLAEVEQNGVKYPIVGYKNVGAGRVWFIGLNLLYYSELSHSSEITASITELTLAETEVTRRLTYPAVPTEAARFGDGQLEFTYNAPQSQDTLVSFTYSPRWRATVDGQAIALNEYQHLLRAQLPAGRHQLQITYDPYGTIWPRLGLGVGVGSVLLLVSLAVAEAIRSRQLKDEAARRIAGGSLWDERRAKRSNTFHAPCLNCGFRLAEAAPPTAGTYPFNLISCPICGQRLDGSGLRPGLRMTKAAREEALNRWLTRQGLDLATVDPQRHFGVADFFEGSEDEEKPGSVTAPELE